MKNAMIVLALCLFATLNLNAQSPQGGRGPRGVNLDEIPDITTAQKEKIEKIQASQREEMQKLFGDNREARRQMTDEQREEMRKKMDEMREKTHKEIEGVLNAEQFKVYKEKVEALRPQGSAPGNGQGRGPQGGRKLNCVKQD